MLRLVLIFTSLIYSASLRAEPRDVDLILALATDVSESIDDDEYALQKDGITSALTEPDVVNAVEQCAPNELAIAYLEWSSDLVPVVGFTHVTDQPSLAGFAASIAKQDRSSNQLTNIADALENAARLILRSPFRAPRRVIDISSDGVQNFRHLLPREAPAPSGARPSLKDMVGERRDDLVGRGFVINALVVDVPGTVPQGTDGEVNLEAYHTKYVIGGERAFAHVVHSFDDYRTVFKRKLKREICNVGATREPRRDVALAHR